MGNLRSDVIVHREIVFGRAGNPLFRSRGRIVLFGRSRRSRRKPLRDPLYGRTGLPDLIGVFRKRAPLKIGIVKHLNARPLTWGFEQDNKHEIVSENPAILKDYLLNGEIDLGLISSIECLRNEKILNTYYATGVCAREKVRSILFFKNKREEFPPRLILTDNGSKTSMSLVRVLVHEESGVVPDVRPTDSNTIQEQIENGIGSHMLFGDNALLAKWNPDFYEVKDLAQWWNEITGLGFIFALWASKKPLEAEDSLLIQSLEYGISHIEEIISHESRLPESVVREYLTRELHYKVTEEDRNGFLLFGDKCKKLNLL